MVHHRRSSTPVNPGRSRNRPVEHHQRIPVVQHLGRDQVGEEVAQGAARLGHRPSQRVNLQGLQQVLGPMRQDNHHEALEGPLVPGAVDAVEKRRLHGCGRLRILYFRGALAGSQ